KEVAYVSLLESGVLPIVMMRKHLVFGLAAIAALDGVSSVGCSSNPTSLGSGLHNSGGSSGASSASSGTPTTSSSSGGQPGSASGMTSSSGASSSAGMNSASGSGGVSGDSGNSQDCKANCTGKTCGDDGCGGTCGGCPPSPLCGMAETCVASPSTTTIVGDANSQ